MTHNINTTDISKPPYPRLGEIYRAITLALDTKAKNRDIDRLAREGDYDWSLLPTLSEELITIPLRKYIDQDFSSLVEEHINRLHSSYINLISTVPIDGLNRQEALPILIKSYFSYHAAGLLLNIKDKFGGPNLMEFLDVNRNPIEVVITWSGNSNEKLSKIAFPGTTGEDKSNRESIDRWSKGIHLPDLISIRLFIEALSKNNPSLISGVGTNLKRWLIIARAIAWFETISPIAIRELMNSHIQSGDHGIDVGTLLSNKLHESGRKLSMLKMPALLLYEELKRTAEKDIGAMKSTRNDLNKLEHLINIHDSEKITQFHLDWLNGRWFVLSGNFDNALLFTKQAVHLASYRAGAAQKQIFQEALVIAGQLGDKPFLKQLKHRAIAFGLFIKPSSNNVIEDWEIEQLRQNFQQVFPKKAYFPEIQSEISIYNTLPFLVADIVEMQSRKADLRKPDRIVTIRYLDEQIRRQPQLMLFTSLGRFNEVKKLLDCNANVNQLDSSGASALLFAMQYAYQTGDQKVLNLLLQYKHTPETLNSITERKQLSPLICAIEYGEPDVVEQLLKMGASADGRGNIVNQTPLYICIENIGAIRNPQNILLQMRNKIFGNPDLVQREVLRRYNVNLAGVFGDSKTINNISENHEYKEILDKLVTAMVIERCEHHSESKLISIAKLLLKYKANPNATHDYPEKGRTPLMLAAESNSREAFDLLLKNGGNPYQQDLNGLNSIKIAYGFKSRDVINLLYSEGIT